MSRPDHIVNRFQTTMGDSWWWRRYADLTDRRNEDGTFKPFDPKAAAQYETRWQRLRGGRSRQPTLVHQKAEDTSPPEMLPRPEGMTRQQHRAAYRAACKLAGKDWRRVKAGMEPAAFNEAEWEAFCKEHGIPPTVLEGYTPKETP